MAVVLATGCMEAPNRAPASNQNHSTQAPTANETVPNAGAAFTPTPLLEFEGLHLADCNGSMTRFDAPSGTWAGTLPDGWSDNELVSTTIYTMECKRIAVGPFERAGRLAWQEQGNPSGTSACGEGDINQLDYLHAIVTDDASLAAYFADVLHMPVEHAAFAVETMDQGHVHTQTWTIGTGSASRVQVSNLTIPLDSATFPLNRLAWKNDVGGISYLHYNMSYEDGTFDVAQLNLHPPFIPGAGHEAVAATGGPVWAFNLSASIHHFRDLACLEPY